MLSYHLMLSYTRNSTASRMMGDIDMGNRIEEREVDGEIQEEICI